MLHRLKLTLLKWRKLSLSSDSIIKVPASIVGWVPIKSKFSRYLYQWTKNKVIRYHAKPIWEAEKYSFCHKLQYFISYIFKTWGCKPHCGLKVSRSQVKIYENFANYFLKTKANNKCFKELNVHVKGYRKVKVSYSGKI